MQKANDDPEGGNNKTARTQKQKGKEERRANPRKNMQTWCDVATHVSSPSQTNTEGDPSRRLPSHIIQHTCLETTPALLPPPKRAHSLQHLVDVQSAPLPRPRRFGTAHLRRRATSHEVTVRGRRAVHLEVERRAKGRGTRADGREMQALEARGAGSFAHGFRCDGGVARGQRVG
jgi:hypothetical protein